jgi:hypothetical protein
MSSRCRMRPRTEGVPRETVWLGLRRALRWGKGPVVREAQLGDFGTEIRPLFASRPRTPLEGYLREPVGTSFSAGAPCT